MKSLFNSTAKYLLTLFILSLGITFQPADAQNSWQQYGEEITATNALDANEAISQFSKDGKKLKVQGTITAVCSMKGCWASFVTDNEKTIKVKFRNHNFLIPTESAGLRMTAKGVAFKDKVDTDAETGSEEAYEYRLVADGVLLEK
ncbi:DUF4920 domain-containing protein [Fodinibius halophilus]|uniref:DUF4920 domain-containing protein n=1 Tax=Fodinibius halophilus TaxID=1736908 RepID=A0A6M1SYL1_9BACT|nr:DUF4920 domain-containing protein [Fodinibius halophilus]NGP86717.1 DUF4920 domain-containing protein [Fodinibius halophilus]